MIPIHFDDGENEKEGKESRDNRWWDVWPLPTGESLNNTLGSRLDGEETASYIR